jgi:anti-sigma factor ChrR (cupin superfamily)
VGLRQPAVRRGIVAAVRGLLEIESAVVDSLQNGIAQPELTLRERAMNHVVVPFTEWAEHGGAAYTTAWKREVCGGSGEQFSPTSLVASLLPRRNWASFGGREVPRPGARASLMR